jgi:nucleotidyltransferase substrate binding protein (TIGR01987 family)
MKIDLSLFEKAIASLEEVLQLEKTAIIRDSAIQRFEYTFEFAVKFMRRYIQENYSVMSDYDSNNFRDVIRTALQLNITKKSFETWIKYRDARNKTSHGYSEKAAEEVYEVAQEFLVEAKLVYQFLKNHFK